MFQIRKIKFWVECKRNSIEDLYIKVSDTPRIKDEIIAKIENEKEATKFYEKEKKKLPKTSMISLNEYKGEELILEEIEEEGMFKGRGMEIDSYINIEE